MDKQTLERMLSIVQELKTEHHGYIGTLEAWGAIKAAEKVMSLPKEVADAVNKELILFQPKTYLATPGRLHGLSSILYDATAEDDRFSLTRRVIAMQGAYHYWFSIRDAPIDFSISYDTEIKVAESVRYLLQFFEEANTEKISSNQEFGRIVAHVMKEEYLAVREKIEDEKKEKCDEYVDQFNQTLLDADWDEEMSEKSFIRKMHEELKAVKKVKLKTERMIKRIKRDRVDNRIEYRRFILSKELLERIDTSSELFESLGLNYETCIQVYDEIIKNHKKNLQYFLDFRKGMIKNNAQVIQDHLEYLQVCKGIKVEPEIIIGVGIGVAEDLIENYVFIRECLAKEKNWVIKFLKH